MLVVVKENNQVTLGEDGEADFIQDRGDRYRQQGIGILQWAREIGLSPEYSMYGQELAARELSRGSVDGKLL